MARARGEPRSNHFSRAVLEWRGIQQLTVISEEIYKRSGLEKLRKSCLALVRQNFP